MNEPNIARTAWICRCVHRLHRLAGANARLPDGRPMGWHTYQRLLLHILSEYREDV